LSWEEPSGRVWRPGAGRKTAVPKDPTLRSRSASRTNDARRPGITIALERRTGASAPGAGPRVEPHLARRIAQRCGLHLQGNRETEEGDSHLDRDGQFGNINAQVVAALAEQQPVISVETKNKELVGDFRNAGREYRPRANPEEVRVHDFLIKELGCAVPYGVYDLAANFRWVSVGVDL